MLVPQFNDIPGGGICFIDEELHIPFRDLHVEIAGDGAVCDGIVKGGCQIITIVGCAESKRITSG